MSKSPKNKVSAAIRKARVVSLVLPFVMFPALMSLVGSGLVLFVYAIAAVLDAFGLFDVALIDMNFSAVWLVGLSGVLLYCTGSLLVRVERKLWADVVAEKRSEQIDRELF